PVSHHAEAGMRVRNQLRGGLESSWRLRGTLETLSSVGPSASIQVDICSPTEDYICMYLSTSEAARELGVSDRQVRRAAANGRLVASRHGSAHSVSTRHVRMLARTKHRGRSWSVR